MDHIKRLFCIFLLGLMSISLSGCMTTRPSATADFSVPRNIMRDASGTVVDEEGSRIAGAEVLLYRAQSPWGIGDKLIARTRTDSRGRFRFRQSLIWVGFTNVQGGIFPHYQVIANHPNLGMDYGKILRSDSSDNLLLTLRPKTEHIVRAFDGNGKPVKGARVFLTHAEKEGPEPRKLTVFSDLGIASGDTDAEGKCLVPAFADGCGFRVVKRGLASETVYSHDGLASVTLRNATTIWGKVTKPNGSPAVNAIVYREFPSGYSLARTNSRGNYFMYDVPAHRPRFWGEPPVDYSKPPELWNTLIHAEAWEIDSLYFCKVANVMVDPHGAVRQDLNLLKGIGISGRVMNVDSNNPVPYIQIGVDVRHLIDYRPYPTSIATDGNGNFCLAIPAGINLDLVWSNARRADGYMIDEQWISEQSGTKAFRPFSEVVCESRSDLTIPVKAQRE